MPTRPRTLLKAIISAALCWAGALTPAAQTPAEGFRNVLRRQAAFTSDDLSALEREGMVVKLLPAGDRREVAVCGVIRLQGTPAASLAAFRKVLAQKTNLASLGGGSFGVPPALADLQSLTLEDRDIEDIRRCAAGDCKLKMSAAMMERLRKEVDWGAQDYRLQATRLYRLMLLDYVRDYLARGEAALMQYHDQEAAVSLSEELRSLLHSLPYVNDSAPEFANYLQKFPHAELPGVENAFEWWKLKFGLKPVTVITHTATYGRDSGRQILVAAKQLYANHYFDSSLALALFIQPSADGPSPETYLLYTNRSRADGLKGLLGGIRRYAVEEEAVEGLTTILRRTKLNSEAPSSGQPGPDAWAATEADWPPTWTQRLLSTARLLLILFMIVASALLAWLKLRDA